MQRLTIIITLYLATLVNIQAQGSVRVIAPSDDTVQIKSYAARYSPRKALLYAAVLPGLGQIYNKKYWKLPLVYGGFFAIGHGINFYQEGYVKYRSEYFLVLETGSSVGPSGFTKSQLDTIVQRYRRERDFMIILMGGMYILQIIDAHVDAHLKEFDLNPNLQVSLEPSLKSDMLAGTTAGIGIFLRF